MMIDKFKNFELNKKQQKEINGSDAPIPNVDACARATGLFAGGVWWAGIGRWIHC
ncbi:hypothetical protein C7447_102142 [Tenacibaculum adriaticum]|uniref:Uncharacterized protein n=1 Tax=Tenacibaculum adriaticum TaxID=413713 RepID=A0A5S5DSG3_9FLAO|nr:hypothetical protein [Tenacibaculum adriaticum]TYP98827.1 hypothetical protein C7447_102142 [Tenacibaculum adriaticum]